MRQTDVLIVGGGLAGSLTAAMLGRRGFAAVMVDPHEVYPPELRCEKLDGGQLAILEKTGLADAVLKHTALAQELSVVRQGRLVDRKPGLQRGILYADFVAAIRAAIPLDVVRIKGKVSAIETGADRQAVTLSDGETISARLVVLANGLNLALRESLGMTRRMISPTHSITAAFDVVPVGRQQFDFEGLTYYPRRPADRFAYLTLFPTVTAMRANFMFYREAADPLVVQLRREPKAALLEAIPDLEALIGAFEVQGTAWVRPADLYQTENVARPGVVLVGDAFATSCPAAGTGAGKVLNDVERLCNGHLGDWLASPGMGADKISSFYRDPEKLAYDKDSLDRAFALKATSIDPGWTWAARRWGKFGARAAIGSLRRLRRHRPSPVATGSVEMAGRS